MEPLGQSQIFQYLRKLARDHQITLVSYEKRQDWADSARRKALEAEVTGAGLRWVALRYHKRPTSLATAYDLAVGYVVGAYLLLRYRIRIVHARSYVPAVLALALKWTLGTRFIFDMRGFWADQRVDCGAWRGGTWLYRAAKWLERRFLTSADVVMSLTHAAVAVMRDFPYLRDNPPRFEVIPTCTNLEIFRPSTHRTVDETSRGRPFILGCLGSVNLWYLFDLMLECFEILRELQPEARLHIINRGDHAFIRERLEAAEIPDGWAIIKSVPYHDVPREIGEMDAGIFFLKPFFSLRAVAPTKLGEFLACGIPCLANADIGDFEKILEGEGVGVILRGSTRRAKEAAVRGLLALVADPGTRQRCVEASRRYFSLDKGVQAYDRIYRSLTDANVLD